jgi:anti-sigma-K factor RskA
MTEFEQQLKQAMARRDPPPGFVSRVLARAAQEESWGAATRGTGWWKRAVAWRLAAALTCISLAVSAGWMYRQHEREIRGEAAKKQLLLAVRIAGTKLQHAHRRILQVEDLEQ